MYEADKAPCSNTPVVVLAIITILATIIMILALMYAYKQTVSPEASRISIANAASGIYPLSVAPVLNTSVSDWDTNVDSLAVMCTYINDCCRYAITTDVSTDASVGTYVNAANEFIKAFVAFMGTQATPLVINPYPGDTTVLPFDATCMLALYLMLQGSATYATDAANVILQIVDGSTKAIDQSYNEKTIESYRLTGPWALAHEQLWDMADAI